MLCDTGLARDFLKGVSDGGLDMKLNQPITDQLKALGLISEDIRYVELIHSHVDHIGQLIGSTVQCTEPARLAWKPPELVISFSFLSPRVLGTPSQYFGNGGER